MTEHDPVAAAYDPEAFRARGHRLVDRLASYLQASRDGSQPVVVHRDPATLLESFRMPLGATPVADLDDLLERFLEATIRQHHPRCFAHQVAAPLPIAALFDLAASLVNNGMASYESGPASSAMERVAVGWLSASLGMDDRADGVLTSGGTLGTLTAMLAMRQARAGFDVWAAGSEAGPPLCVLSSADAHYCVSRAVQVMGWGQAGVQSVPLDTSFRMRVDALPDALRRAADAGRKVVGVVATAGSSTSGAIDPLSAIADFCHRRDLWLHVDGAHGAAAAFSSPYRSLLEGIERADSVVWDGHKLLALPGLATALVYRDGARSYGAFRQEASYLFDDDGESERWYDYGLRNMECTKRMMSVKVYLTLASLGTAVLDRYVSGRFELARRFAAELAEASDFELACQPECNIVCFRYAPDGEPVADAVQDRIRVMLMKRGDFLITRSRLSNRTWMRCTLMSPHTREQDLAQLLDAIRGLDLSAARSSG